MRKQLLIMNEKENYKMRIAVISDVHGNIEALESVYKDLKYPGTSFVLEKYGL